MLPTSPGRALPPTASSPLLPEGGAEAAQAAAGPSPSPEQIQAFENSRLRRATDFARRVGGAGVPAWHWASGAFGASVVTAAMALSTQRSRGLGEMATAETAAGVGAGMFLAGLGGVLDDALACRSAQAVALGAFALCALGGVVLSGPLLAAESFPVRLAGAVLYAAAVDSIAITLSRSFAASHDMGDSRHIDLMSVYLGAFFAGGCLLGASAVATGLVWRLGAFGVTGATVFAVTSGAHVLLSCCGRVAFVLYAQYQEAARRELAAVGGGVGDA